MKQKLKQFKVLLALSILVTVIAEANDQTNSLANLNTSENCFPFGCEIVHIPELPTLDTEGSTQNTDSFDDVEKLRVDASPTQVASEAETIPTVEFENTADELSAQTVEKIKPNEVGKWIIDGYGIYVDMRCSISRSSFIPTKDCYPPRVVISNREGNLDYLNTPRYFKLTTGNIELGDKSEFDTNNNPNRMTSISDVTLGTEVSEELFKLLTLEPNTQLNFMSKVDSNSAIKARTIILSDFKPNTDKLIADINYHYDQEEESARVGLILGLMVVITLVAITIWLAKLLIIRANKQLKTIKDSIENRHTSRVATDEAIRAVVRSSIQKVDNKSLDGLRSQIKVALDSGDTKTAEELLKILTRLEQNQIQ